MAHRRITAYEKTCPAMLLRHVSIFDMRAGSPIFSYQNYMTLYTKLSDALQASGAHRMAIAEESTEHIHAFHQGLPRVSLPVTTAGAGRRVMRQGKRGIV